MRVLVFSTKAYDREFLEAANRAQGHELVFLETRLDEHTAQLAKGAQAVCAFVNDHLNEAVLRGLFAAGVRIVLLRCAGFNNVDLGVADELGLVVARVPAYSPYAVAEHAVGLVLSLNRHLHKAYARVREGNFSLQGLCGFDLHERTVGVIGTGNIGAVFSRIMAGFGCRLLGFDPVENAACRALGMQYVSLPELCRQSDIISLHCPLAESTRHLIDETSIAQMKPGVMLINTGRGALIDTPAVVRALKSGQIGFLGIDVYEEEESLFFRDRSAEVIQDDVFMRLLTFPNVMVTAHQGFFTQQALTRIAETTLQNVTSFATGRGELHRVSLQHP